MKRIIIGWVNGDRIEFTCTSASYGHQSHNVILSNAKAEGWEKPALYVTIPLANILMMSESEVE